jgi:hypothetical protein
VNYNNNRCTKDGLKHFIVFICRIVFNVRTLFRESIVVWMGKYGLIAIARNFRELYNTDIVQDLTVPMNITEDVPVRYC